MRMRREGQVRAVGVVALAMLTVTVAGCGTGEKARRDAEMAALVKQVDELKKSQAQITQDMGRLSGELKALDAQGAFLVGETKAQAQERDQLKGALQQQDGALRTLRSALDETNQKVTALSVPSPAAFSSASSGSVPHRKNERREARSTSATRYESLAVCGCCSMRNRKRGFARMPCTPNRMPSSKSPPSARACDA
jgi:prefoldin subunit 5